MRSFRLSIAIISAVICSTYATAASSSHWNAYKQKELFLENDTTKPAPEKDILVKEITTVKIKGYRDNNCPLKSVLNNIEDKEVFISLCYGDECILKSIDMNKPCEWNTNCLLEGLVNGHITIDPDSNEKLVCEVRVRNKSLFGPMKNVKLFRVMDIAAALFLGIKAKEKTIVTATFEPEQLKSQVEKGTIQARLKFKEKVGRPVMLELGLHRENWNELYSTSKSTYNGDNVEPFFQLTGKFFIKTMDEAHNKKAWEFKETTDPACIDLKMITPLPDEFPLLSFPETDEFDPVPSKVKTTFKILALLPFKDSLTHYANRSHGISDIRQKVGKYIPEPKEGRWANPATDASMKRVYFSSIGNFFVKKAEGFKNGYIADVTDIAKYNVRENEHKYVRYGAKTFFDEEGNIQKIEDNDGTVYKPGDEYWEWAKLKSRTAAFSKAAFVHLAEAHYCWGNRGGDALRMFLPPEHPIRRACTPHFYKTHHTCIRAQNSLFDEAGLLFRGLALTYEGGLKQVFMDYIGNFEFSRYPDDIKRQGVENCPFHVGALDGLDLHTIFCNYISELLEETYENAKAFKQDNDMKRMHEYLVKTLKIPRELRPYTLDNVKAIWGEILFRVTGFHNAVGAVTAFALDPAMTNIRQQEKEIGKENGTNLVASEEGASGVAFISAITQLPCPTIGQCWKQILANPDAKSYANLRKALDKLEETIEIRNQVRFRNVDYSPKHCAISISS